MSYDSEHSHPCNKSPSPQFLDLKALLHALGTVPFSKPLACIDNLYDVYQLLECHEWCSHHSQSPWDAIVHLVCSAGEAT